MDSLKRNPGYPVLFEGPYGDIRHGVTDGREGECWRVIELTIDESAVDESDYVWIVPADYITFDPEYDGDIDAHGDEFPNSQYMVLALPVLVAGCISAWVGLFMLVGGDLRGFFGFALFLVCFYLAWLLVDDEDGE